MIHRLSLLLATALLALGCAPTLATARSGVNAVSSLYQQTKVPLEQQYEEAQIACVEHTPPPPREDCVAEVRRAWAPVRLAEEAFYKAVLLAQSVVGTAEAAAAIGRSPDMLQVMVVVIGAVEAGERLRDAVEVLHRASDHSPAIPAAPVPPPAPAPRPIPTAPLKPLEGGAS